MGQGIEAPQKVSTTPQSAGGTPPPSQTCLTFAGKATYAPRMEFFARLVQLLSYIVIIDVLLRWVQQPNQAPLKWTMQVTEPLYAPIRAALPSMGGFDLSPLALILGLNLLQMLLYQALA